MVIAYVWSQCLQQWYAAGLFIINTSMFKFRNMLSTVCLTSSVYSILLDERLLVFCVEKKFYYVILQIIKFHSKYISYLLLEFIAVIAIALSYFGSLFKLYIFQRQFWI